MMKAPKVITHGHGFADQSISKSYRVLRYLAGGSLVLMPILTAVIGFLVSYPLQDSLSDYYFLVKDGGLPRTLFVGFLFFLGGVLIAYRGLDDTDDRIHTVAGIFAFVIAAFPLHCSTVEHPYCVPGLFPFLHLPAAGLLYLSAVRSVYYAGGPKLQDVFNQLPDQQKLKLESRLINIRYVSLILMTIGILTYIYHRLMNTLHGTSWLFWIEYFGFLGFGIYWIRIMWLIDDANREGKLMVKNIPPRKPRESPADTIELGIVKPQASQEEIWVEIP